ncbi:MAG: hypothetical protein QOD95_25 [Gammaproteobacteria bacterium]|jgi:hypothetical protein|nr:hypothetical protein [Gammaproteobacteria bacterium]
MFNRLFLDHPRSVGESYFGHQRQAMAFGARMFVGAIACFLHGIIPAAFTQTGSRTVSRLYDRMVVNRKIHLAKGPRIAPTPQGTVPH